MLEKSRFILDLRILENYCPNIFPFDEFVFETHMQIM